MAPTDPVDVVFTWVDDSIPGYRDNLESHAITEADRLPARTRDNFQFLRFALRSLSQNLPGFRRIHIVCARPQVPAWLRTDHPRIFVVHHDQIMDAALLPTFNSFAIVSHLHLIPGLTQRFLYFEDDMLVTRPEFWNALWSDDGRPLVHLDRAKPIIPEDKLRPGYRTSWNFALILADRALSARFGSKPRWQLNHSPQIMLRDVCARATVDFADEIGTTRQSRFRGADNVPPEFLTGYLALETNAAVPANPALSRRAQGFVSLENRFLWTSAKLAWETMRRPLSMTLNDDFDHQANPATEAIVRRWLGWRFPHPSPYEKPGAEYQGH